MKLSNRKHVQRINHVDYCIHFTVCAICPLYIFRVENKLSAHSCDEEMFNKYKKYNKEWWDIYSSSR